MEEIHYVGKLNINIYSVVTPKILSDKVVITEERIALQFLFRAKNNGVVLRIDPCYECGISQGDAEAFALSYRVLIDALVPSEDIALTVNKVSFSGNGFGCM